MTQSWELRPTQPLWAILARSAELLEDDPVGAEARAREVLKHAPAQPHALTLLVSAARVQGDSAGVQALLESLASDFPELAAAHYELGLLRAERGDGAGAIAALRRVVDLEPDHPGAWRILGDRLAALGDAAGAADAYSRQFKSSMTDLLMLEHVTNLGDDQLDVAVAMLREFLKMHPTDLNGLYMMGQLCVRMNRFRDAERMFARALELAPELVAARCDYGLVLHRQSKWEEEYRQIGILLQGEPENPGYRYLMASALYRTGRFREAIAYCDRILGEDPENSDYQMAYASALRIVGRTAQCILVLRDVLRREPDRGDAWWALANLKTFRFARADMECMSAQLADDTLPDESRYQMQFALGKALEDERRYGEAFEQYRRGNSLVRARQPYDPSEITEHVRRVKSQFSAGFLRTVAGRGCPSRDPVFVIGLPRSGSTLVEQILASHSAVEGLGEITALPIIAARIAESVQSHTNVAGTGRPPPLEGEDLRALGEEYLERAGNSRRSVRSFFTDKLPNNFQHLGLICAILPNAKIVTVHRHPLACCFSMYKQLFQSEWGPFYDLENLARYYRDFVDVVSHFDAAIPGRIHHVVYEELVRDPEPEIRRLLDYCSLPFEDACLRFYESERPIATASSEQVRQPVYANANEQWRHFERWLDPLKAALGPVLETYPRLGGDG
ncbi:MAG TPA: sulfotransferase [Rhizomicrobium sp.]|nr:sulfotransferase [Rhizomicrobium sp.]